MDLVAMRGICKAFPGVTANDHVDFSVRPGEIHALLGENGAGKTTLMSILYGFYTPDAGEIQVRGERREINSPKDAMALGIGMVHQHFMLVPQLTVVESVVLGMGARTGRVLNRRKLSREVRELGARYGFALNPEDYIWQLAVGLQQKVEILKALYRGAQTLILDEPTAVLTPQEAEELFTNLVRFKQDGHSIILITHKLDEVKRIADRTTVMRQGAVVGTVETARVSKPELAEMMVGRKVLFRVDKPPAAPGEVRLSVKALTVLNDKRLPALKGVSFELRAGEILGIAGVDGNGQLELGESLTGLRKPVSGEIAYKGRNVAGRAPADILSLGVGHIPEDRHKKGLIADFSLEENLMLGSQRSRRFCSGVALNFAAIGAEAARLIEAFDIRAPGPAIRAGNLSGGNQQKAVLAREMSRDPDVLIALQPTRGLDVGAIEYVHRRLIEARQAGKAILLVSTDLDEVMSLSDRIAVMYAGEIVGIVPPHTPREQLGLMMAGAHAEVVA